MFPPRSSVLEISANAITRLPDEFRSRQQSAHSRNQKRGRPLDCFLEGPVVVGNHLYVVDIPFGRIFRFSLESGTWSQIIQYDGEPNGLAHDRNNDRLLIADFKNGILALDLKTENLSTVTDRFNGERYKGPNDLIVANDESIYFTDQGMSGLQDPSGRVYRLHKDGRMDIVLRNCPSPNGLVLDLSEETLFVAMTRDNSIWHVPIYPDGSTQRTGRFSSYYGMGGPDGMTLDEEGNVFVAHSSLGQVFVHKSNGEPLARIVSTKGNGVTNLTWGGKNMDLLYIVESQTGSILTAQWWCRGIVNGLHSTFDQQT